MKKSLLLVPVLAVMLSFSACGFDIHKQLSTNISETCNNYFVGETNDYYINLFSGSREKVYQLDGISTEKIPYAILSVRCKTARNNEELQFSVEINDNIEKNIEINFNTMTNIIFFFFFFLMLYS